jgi:hypothetical protein
VFEIKVLIRIFQPKRDELAGKLKKKLPNEFYNLYHTPSIIGVIKSESMRQAEQVAHTGK